MFRVWGSGSKIPGSGLGSRLGLGSRFLDFEFWVLDFGFWSLGLGFFLVFGFWFRVLGFGVWSLRFEILGVGFRVSGVVFRRAPSYQLCTGVPHTGVPQWYRTNFPPLHKFRIPCFV